MAAMVKFQNSIIHLSRKNKKADVLEILSGVNKFGFNQNALKNKSSSIFLGGSSPNTTAAAAPTAASAGHAVKGVTAATAGPPASKIPRTANNQSQQQLQVGPSNLDSVAGTTPQSSPATSGGPNRPGTASEQGNNIDRLNKQIKGSDFTDSFC